jgi:hypothetical protein
MKFTQMDRLDVMSRPDPITPDSVLRKASKVGQRSTSTPSIPSVGSIKLHQFWWLNRPTSIVWC